jgi:acyl-CoA reductase-like NAD-dependent aldehyde dehydrogenase
MEREIQEAVLRTIASVNPATGKVLRELECASESDVCAAVERARGAQRDWAEIGIRERISVFA